MQPVAIKGVDFNKCNFPFHLLEQRNTNLVKTNFTVAGRALSINMSKGNIDMLSLIERLENILSVLDESGHPIAAIKVEEAINALRQAEDQQKNEDNS